MDNVSREETALRLDAANNEDPLFTHEPDSRFAFAVLNWNDTCTDAEQYRYCGEVSDTLRQMPDTRSPQDILHDIKALLNASFSERIKGHIVMLVADTETVEGACRHCFDLYDLCL